MELPSLIDLIVNEDDRTFDESRWSILHWLLFRMDQAPISEMRKSNNSKYIRIASLTLDFLKHVSRIFFFCNHIYFDQVISGFLMKFSFL